MIRLIGILAAAALACALPATVTTSFAASSPQTSAPAFSLKSSVAGGITTIQTGQTLTFVFTETNQSKASAPVDLELTNLENATLADGGMVCVLASGAAINPDSPFCEPGFVKPGQHASMVLTTTVTGPSGTSASARVCLSNENTGVVGPCVTRSVAIA